MRPTSINFGAEITDQLKLRADKEGTSLNQLLKGLAEKFLKGELIDAGTTLQGDPSTNCIFKIKRVNACPIREEIAELKKPQNVLMLLKFCGRCPYLKGEIQPRNNRNNENNNAAELKPGDISCENQHWFMCKKKCGTELFWHNSGSAKNPKWQPMERDPFHPEFGLQHYCSGPRADPTAPPSQHEGKKVLPNVTVKCADCSFTVSLQYFAEAIDPIYEAERSMRHHVQAEHLRDYLLNGEDVAEIAKQ